MMAAHMAAEAALRLVKPGNEVSSCFLQVWLATALTAGIPLWYPSRVVSVTYKLALRWQSCQVLGIMGSVLGIWAGTAQSVVCWACCPAQCSVTGSTVWASGRGDFSLGSFPLELTWVLAPSPPLPLSPSPPFPPPRYFYWWVFIPRSSLCTYTFHSTDSKDPDIHVLNGCMLATKTHPAHTIHQDGM